MKYILLFLCLVLCYCSFKEDAPDGLCSNPIKLSKEKLLFSVQGGVDSVFSKSFWWLNYEFEDGCKYIGAENESDYCDYNYCEANLIMKIECPWFSVTQTDEHTAFVSVAKNETGEERKSGVSIQAGNCFSGFSITQSAE